MIIGTDDEARLNVKARSAFEIFPVEDKTLIEVDSDSTILQDKEFHT